MGPMLKHGAVYFQEPLQRRRAVVMASREQDQIMGACDGADAVDLDETQLVNQPCKVGPFARAGGRISQSMAVQKQATGKGIGEGLKGHGGQGSRQKPTVIEGWGPRASSLSITR